MVIEFISLLLTMAALQINCFSSSLTRNKFFNYPALLFLKGMTGALAPFKFNLPSFIIRAPATRIILRSL